jgi:isocitrate lyase
MSEIKRPYTQEQVEKLRGSFQEEYKYAKFAAKNLRHLLQNNTYIHSLGCLNGSQAVQCAKAGLKAIYCSGWQVAAESNVSGETYPDQSLYPVNSVPLLVKRINNALKRADQIDFSEGNSFTDYFLPIVADAEAGFGGPLNAYELMKSMIEAGAAAVHWEDQLSSEKKCGHLHSKVLLPTNVFIKNLVAARLASDVLNVPTLIIARTDAESASYVTSDIDENDLKFIDRSKRSNDGFYALTGNSLERCISRGLSYAPYADLLWFETSTPSLKQAKAFAEAIHAQYPGKWLAYNCSPSFNWKKNLSDDEIRHFQEELGKLGYKYQFVTLAGFHSVNSSFYELADGYRDRGMAAYSELQQKEFLQQKNGNFTAVKHQREVGTGYFDMVRQIIEGDSSMSALSASTEAKQF